MKSKKKIPISTVSINQLTNENDQTFIVLQNGQGNIYSYDSLKSLYVELGETLKQIKDCDYDHFIEDIQSNEVTLNSTEKYSYGTSEFPIHELNIQKIELFEASGVLPPACSVCKQVMIKEHCSHYYAMRPQTKYPYIFEYTQETIRACSEECILTAAENTAKQAIKNEYQHFFDPYEYNSRIATYVKSL